MAISHATLQYFTRVAAKYDEGFIHLIFRKFEQRAVHSLLPSSLKGLHVMEACCGSGYYTNQLSKLSPTKLLAIDVNPEMLRHVSKTSGGETICCDITQYQTSAQYDYIFCFGGLEFNSNPDFILQKFSHWTKERSKLVLLLPRNNLFGHLYKLFHKLHSVDIQLFDKNWVTKRIGEYGWKPRQILTVFPFAWVCSYEKI